MSDEKISRRAFLASAAAAGGTAMIPGGVTKALAEVGTAAAAPAAEKYVYIMGSRGMMRVLESEVAAMGNFAAEDILSDEAGKAMIEGFQQIQTPEARTQTEAAENRPAPDATEPQSARMAWIIVSDDPSQNSQKAEIFTSRGISTVDFASIEESRPDDLPDGFRQIGSFPAENVVILDLAA